MRVNREFEHPEVVAWLEQVDEYALLKIISRHQRTDSTDDYNEETQQVFRDTDAGKNLTSYDSLEALFADLQG